MYNLKVESSADKMRTTARETAFQIAMRNYSKEARVYM